MFKRTKGYLLLTMLVLTGLAGRTHSDTLSGKERRSLIKELKITRAALMETVANLSEQQLNYVAPGTTSSIRSNIYKLASLENTLWQCAKQSLDNGDASAKSNFLDEQLAEVLNTSTLPCRDLQFEDAKEAMKLCKNLRNEMLRYLNTSTQNVRAHTFTTKAGSVDAYQLMLLTAIGTKHYTDEIRQIKSSPGFPE